MQREIKPQAATSPWGPLALPTLVTWMGLQTLRVFFPAVFYVIFPRYGIPYMIAYFVAVFLIPFLTSWGMHIIGVKGMLFLSAGGIVLLRLAEQTTTVSTLDLILSTGGMVLLAAFFPAYLVYQRTRRTRPSGSVALGILLGLSLDTALRGTTLTLDLSWQPELLPIATVVTIAILAFFSLLEELRAPQVEAASDLPAPVALILLGLGSFLALELLVFQNTSQLAQRAGLPFPWAWLVVAGGNILALLAAAIVVAYPSRTFRITAVVINALLFIILLFSGGTVALITVLLGHAVAGFDLALILTTLLTHSGEEGDPKYLGLAGAGAMAAMFLLLGTFYGFFSLSLILPLAALLLWLAAIAATFFRSTAERHSPFLLWAPAGLAGVLLILALVQGLTWQMPAATPPPPGGTIRIMTYNLHQGFDTEGFLSIEAIAQNIEASGAHVVGLQEVQRGWIVDGGLDMVTWLSQRLGMPYVFAPTIGGTLGNAILSRVPILASESQIYPPHAQSPFPRGYLRATVATSSQPLHIIVTHLDSEPGAVQARLSQIETLLKGFPALAQSVLMGDLNAGPDSQEMRQLRNSGLWLDAFALIGRGKGHTYPSDALRKRIDYIWVSPDLEPSNLVIIQSTASDHLGIVVDVHLP